MSRDRVLLAAGGEDWETTALQELDRGGVLVVKRCVDIADLLATAAAGLGDVAVVCGTLPGLDADAVQQLLRHDVRTVAVGGSAEALSRLGTVAVLGIQDTATLADAVRASGLEPVVAEPERVAPAAASQDGARGKVVAVHGPGGAPGRTTVAIGLAAAHAAAGCRSLVIDADPYGGVVAQHLGVLDEVSGLLAAARLANAGALDDQSFTRCRRAVGEALEVVTGLPRADRWVEVRAGALESVLDVAAQVGAVFVDTGFSLEGAEGIGTLPGPGRVSGRNQMTLEALAAADEVVVVGSAEPPALARLARTLVDLREVTSAPARVVVNRMRDSLGWSRRDIAGMIEGYLRPLGVSFLPEDRIGVDRALVAGRTLRETGDSPLRRALDTLHQECWGTTSTRMRRSA